jgi:hypothetical protein
MRLSLRRVNRIATSTDALAAREGLSQGIERAHDAATVQRARSDLPCAGPAR